MSTEEKLARAQEIDKRSRNFTHDRQKQLAKLLADVIETGLKTHTLNDEDNLDLIEQLEGLRLSIELDF